MVLGKLLQSTYYLLALLRGVYYSAVLHDKRVIIISYNTKQLQDVIDHARFSPATDSVEYV